MSDKRIVARFHPQAWVNDYAIEVEVDSEDPVEWDVTDRVLAMGREAALRLRDDQYETDVLRELPCAPAWVREWSGPFYVAVERSVHEYFGVDLPDDSE